MASNLKVDFDVIQSVIRQYNNVVDDFENIINTLDKSIDLLRNSGWDSPASKAYFQTYDETWKKNMVNHIKIISFLRECLKEAENDYSALQRMIPDIGRTLDI